MGRRSLAALALGVLLLGTAAAAARSASRRQERAERSRRGETSLVVTNLAAAEVSLYRAGEGTADAKPVELAPEETWLPEGRYFLEASRGGLSWFYPVPLGGSARGPDTAGAFAVTVRARGADGPPDVGPGSPPFAFVPAGHFEIGERKNPLERHYVWTTAFHVAVFEVTNGEFREFLADPDGDGSRASWTEAGWGWKGSGRSEATALLRPGDAAYPRFGRDDLPVVRVTWYEANAYARWLTRRLGAGRWLYRLPTEAEWEKAARGPDGFDYGLGNELSEPQAGLYNWKKNPEAAVTLVGWEETPGRYRANRFGLYHASGNAAEWTQTVARPYNRNRPYRDDDRVDDSAKGNRTTRGGSWYSATTSRLGLGYREDFLPQQTSEDLGFRIVALPLPASPR